MYRIGKEEIAAVTRVIESKELFKVNSGEGQEVYNFEKEWKEKMGSAYALCMTSGKAALICGLIALDIGPGDEVIVPGYTYIASAIAVLAAGAIPVIAEVDETLTLDIHDVEKKITPHTKAIMPVHIMGFPNDMDSIMALAKKYNLKVIEDSCQADGATYHGKRLGTIGDVGAYSFNFFKIISAGEGGLMATNNKSVFEKALIYHDSSAVAFFGDQLSDVSVEPFAGVEYRVGEITGAIMRQQLKKLDGIIADLHKVKNDIWEKVSDTGLKLLPSYDRDGELSNVIAFRFDTEAIARKFATADGILGTLPIDTGKHVYKHWTPVLRKKGGANDRINPYHFPENKALNVNYSEDMCPNTLDYLSRTVYINLNPDWTDAECDELANKIREAAKLI